MARRAMYRTSKEIFLVPKSQRNGKRQTIKKGFPLYSDLQEGTGLELGVPRRQEDTFWPEGVQSQKQAGEQVKNQRGRVRKGPDQLGQEAGTVQASGPKRRTTPQNF